MTSICKSFCLIIFSFLLLSCASTDYNKNTFPMAVFLPIENSQFGAISQDMLNAMNLAVEEINEAGGINGKPLALVIKSSKEDDSFDSGKRLQSLIDSGIKIFHVGFTNQIVLEHKLLGQNPDIFVNYLSGYPSAVVLNNNSVRIFLNGAQEGELMAKAVELLPADHNVEKVMITTGVDDFLGKSCCDYLLFHLRTENVKCYNDVYPYAEKNFDVFAQQCDRLNANYFFMFGYGESEKALLNSLIKEKFKGLFVTNCGFHDDVEGTVPANIAFYKVSTLYQNNKIDSLENKKFKVKYKSRFGKTPDWYAAYAYDSIILTAQAANSGSTIADYKNFFVNKTFSGAIGKIKFDSAGDSLSELELVRK